MEQSSAREHLIHENHEFNIRTTLTFGVDEANEPSSVTVEAPNFLTAGVLREFASEALDSHFGLSDHAYLVHPTPLSREDMDEDYQEVTFDVRKRRTFQAPTFTLGEPRPAFGEER